MVGRETTAARETWGDLIGRALPEFRAAYLAEVERFAEELEPEFRSGALRGYVDGDSEVERDLDAEEAELVVPFRRITKLCSEHFGIGVPTDDEASTAREALGAGVVLAVSPNAAATAAGGWEHFSYWAAEAITWDVLLLARARDWYRPAADESWRPRCNDSCGDHPGSGSEVHSG